MYLRIFVGFVVIEEHGVVRVLLMLLNTSFFYPGGFLFIYLGGFYIYGGKGCRYP